MTDSTNDPALGSVALAALRDATLELHHAVQLIASAGQAYVPRRTDDSHRAMTWSHALGGFRGEPFGPESELRVGLDVEALTVRILRGDAPDGEALPLSGRTMAEARAWLADAVARAGGPEARLEPPEFEIPTHPVGQGRAFSGERGAELAELAHLYGGAAAILEDVAAGWRGAETVRCWPHHFDIATLLTVRPAEGVEAARTIGVGLAPMGGGYETWYWYVTPWPYPDAGALPELDGPGRWHTEGWVGAVLEAAQVVAQQGADAQRSLVRNFLAEAVAACRAALS